MSSFPIFPEIRSVDFAQHLSISRDYSMGHFQPLSAQLLYAGVEYYLAIPQALFPHGDPFVLTRWAMALLVIVSPIVIYLTSKEILYQGERKKDLEKTEVIAKVTALSYALSGLIWVQMVFISGLYANFWGVLASLFLAAAVFRMIRIPSGFSIYLLVLALVNAAFSHYSVLLIFPPLIAYAAWKKSKVGTGFLMAPIIGGAVLFPRQILGLIGFLQPTANVTPQPSALSPFLIVPSLQYLTEEVTDYQFLFLMLCVGIFGYAAYKKRNGPMLILVAWFAICLAVAPWNSSAWRFSLNALVPATLMIGWVISRIPHFPFFADGRNLFFIALFIIPIFYPSWGFFAMQHSGDISPQDPKAASDIYQAIQWIGKNLPILPRCHDQPQQPLCPHMVSLTDWRFTYVPLFNGPMVFYAPDYGVIFTDPFQAAIFTSLHNSTYIIVTKDTTVFLQPSCDPRQSLGLTLSANSTVVKPNERILIKVSTSALVNTQVGIYSDGIEGGLVRLINGSGWVVIYYPAAGNHTVFAALSNIETANLNVTIGSRSVSSAQIVAAPSDFCLPWRTFNQATLPGFSLIYQNPDVKIWEAPKNG